MNLLGDRLREARRARGLTQEQLGRGLASKGFICQVERNRAMPSLAKLRLLADRLGLPVGYFTGSKSADELVYLRKSAELAVRANEPANALGLVDEALALTPSANDRADLFRVRGTALDALGRLDEALAAHQTAAAVAPPDDPELNAAIYVEVGTVLLQREQFNGAVEANLRALQWMDRSKHSDPALRARLLTNLGRTSYSLGQLAAADGYFQQALVAATDAENVFRIASAHMSLGVSARAVGDLERAIAHCNRALELHGRIRQERTANRVLNNLGDVHYAAGRKSEARRIQLRCLERARELKDDFEIGVSAGALASYAMERNDIDESLRLAIESQAAAQRSGDHLHQAYSVAIEGWAAERSGRRALADRKFRAAFQSLAERHAAGKLAEVAAMYADVLRGRGQVDLAFAFMRMAAERDFASLAPLLKKTRR
ncbi:MAG: tetratricopeptide repeat protein [Candidatus Dormibacteraeota bacterium]|nr:tetratricopeptide repeat protein [Candidatus Dormibacteraeota bacterium]